jgi:hypothetical protein
MFEFYWTDAVSGKGVKVFVENELDREKILQHYFEASIGPIQGVKYPEKSIPYQGTISRR